MLCSCQSGISAKMVSLVPALWVASTCAILLINPTAAPAASPLPETTAQWTFGPTNISLGTVADLSLEHGWRFTGARDARLALRELQTPVPRGLMGLMKTATGQLWMLVSFEPGYVQDPEEQIDAKTVLQRWGDERKKQLQPGESLIKLDWTREPTRNPPQHAWEYALMCAVKGDSGISPLTYHTRRILTKTGLLTITVISLSLVDQAGFDQLLQKVSLKNGQAYADAPAGEKITRLSAAELLVRNGDWESPSEAATASNKAMRSLIMVGLGIAVLVAAASVALVLVLRKVRRPRFLAANRLAKEQAQDSTPEAPPAPSIPIPARDGFRPKLTPTPLSPKEGKERNGRAMKPILNRNGAHRKREFDYNRYFTDLMSAVSSHGLALEQAQQRIENYSLGAMAPQAANSGAQTAATGDGNSDLIANQATFIEEQQRLIQEQTRLIEEKSRLIAEKNQLLKLQSELIENKLL